MTIDTATADDLVVRGDATDEELAAVVAALRAADRKTERLSNYERWRRARLRAIRHLAEAPKWT